MTRFHRLYLLLVAAFFVISISTCIASQSKKGWEKEAFMTRSEVNDIRSAHNEFALSEDDSHSAIAKDVLADVIKENKLGAASKNLRQRLRDYDLVCEVAYVQKIRVACFGDPAPVERGQCRDRAMEFVKKKKKIFEDSLFDYIGVAFQPKNRWNYYAILITGGCY